MPSKKDLSIIDMIKAEEARLEKIFANIEEDKKAINQELIKNAAFMAVTLRTLQEQVTNEGAVIRFVNGNGFETINEHPAQKSYNTMINRFTVVIKQLTGLIDKSEDDDNDDELLEFLKR